MEQAGTGRQIAVIVVLMSLWLAGCGPGSESAGSAGASSEPSTRPAGSSATAAPSEAGPSPSTGNELGLTDCADTPNPPTGRIAFDVKSGETRRIAAVLPSGADFQELTDGAGETGGAAWASRGSIILSSDRSGNVHLFTLDPSDEAIEQLTSGDGFEGYPSVSPDGSIIVVDGNVPGEPSGLWLYDANGVRQRRLTTTTAADGFDTGPEFSPDGRSIAFARVLDATPGRARSAIFVVDVDAEEGGEPRQLTAWELNGHHPTWSRDSAQIAFSSNADNNTVAQPADVWVVGADGSGLRQLTRVPPGSNAYEPAWSPTADWLAFLLDGALAVMTVDGAESCVVWRGGPGDAAADPDWGP